MDLPCVRVADEKAPGTAFAKSGHSSVLDFLYSFARSRDAYIQRQLNLCITDDESIFNSGVKYGILESGVKPEVIWIFAERTRDREEAREAGSFARLLHALSSLCFALQVHYPVKLVSEETRALCSGIASHLCRMRILDIENLIVSNKDELQSSMFLVAELGTVLQSDASLGELLFLNCSLPGDVVRRLFASLEQNAHLSRLSLAGCKGSDWPSESFVLDCLRVNGTLTSLDLLGTPLKGKSEKAIDAQLEQNERRVEEQVRVFKKQRSTRVRPTTMRLFLCGLPFSGKTTLAKSLVRWSTGASSLADSLSRVGTRMQMPTRARGIEVSTLEKDGVRVFLWDMVGQQEHYVINDHMFPNFSNDASPFLFLYVWNPVEVHPLTGKNNRDEHGRLIVKDPDSLESDCRYWLRFIASKTLRSLKFKPKLLIAITRADLLKVLNIKSYILNTFHKCQTDFQDYIELDLDGVFEMNARHPGKTSRLGFYIFDCATAILESKPLVYKACDQARRALAESLRSKFVAPLVTKQEFSRLCQKYLGVDGREIQEAVALSLNESGDLIYFKEHELVLLDTQWFYHSLMGDLFSNSTASQREGFVFPQQLEDFLQSKINSKLKGYRATFSRTTRSPSITGANLVKLLVGLQLVICQQDDTGVNSQIFIPASLCTTPERQTALWMYLDGENKTDKSFMGRRLKCKDSVQTFFPPGMFTLLQVSLNNAFIGAKPSLKKDAIEFSIDGLKVLVEFCKHEGRDHFIDVLVHSPLDVDDTIWWAQKKLLDKIERICANPRGIQGVQLVYEVLRPSSVQNLENVEVRLCASVSQEKLCETLIDALEKRGLDAGSLKNVFHEWPSPWNDSDHVKDLIGIMKTLEVVKEFRERLAFDIEDMAGISVAEEASADTSEPEKRVLSSSASGKEGMCALNALHESSQKMDKTSQEVWEDIQDVHKKLARLMSDVQKLQNDALPEITQKVQRLLTFNWKGEAAKLPRLFVVTKDDGLVCKIVGAMVPGLQNVRLQLLCENRRRPHLVTGQRGISFATLEDGLLKQGLPYIKMFLKLAGIAVKVGAHVATGLGSNVPDFDHLLRQVIGDDKFPSLPTHLDFQDPVASRENFQESQKWLFQVLSKCNCTTSTEIFDVFALYRVRYHDTKSVAWLCKQHGHKGEICPT